MAELTGSSIDSVNLEESVVVSVVTPYNTFGTVTEADVYFGVMLHGEIWERQTPIRKYKALVSATQLVNDLRYAGRKTDESQMLEFPRNGATTVPLAIKQATYEVGLALLKGANVESEYNSLFVSSRGFGSVKTDFDTDSAPEHKKSGIPSLRAWQLLLPYLKPNTDLRLRRVD